MAHKAKGGSNNMSPLKLRYIRENRQNEMASSGQNNQFPLQKNKKLVKFRVFCNDLRCSMARFTFLTRRTGPVFEGICSGLLGDMFFGKTSDCCKVYIGKKFTIYNNIHNDISGHGSFQRTVHMQVKPYQNYTGSWQALGSGQRTQRWRHACESERIAHPPCW